MIEPYHKNIIVNFLDKTNDKQAGNIAFVGNIDIDETNEDEIRNNFATCGKIDSCTFGRKDSNSNLKNDFVLLHFREPNSVRKSCDKFHNKKLNHSDSEL